MAPVTVARPSPIEGSPTPKRITPTPLASTAAVVYRLPPVKIRGTRRRKISRVMPPPTAVIVPSSSAGIQPRPTASVLPAPVAAQQPSASASTAKKARFHSRPFTGTK